MPRSRTAKRQLVIGNPGRCPVGFPVLEYQDGKKFYEGDIWVCPPQTTLEIEQSLVIRGYLVEMNDG